MAEDISADEAPPAERPTRDAAGSAIASLIAVVATIIGLLLLAWAVLFVTKGRFLKGPFENYMSRTTQRDVNVAGDFQLYFNPIDIKFLAEGMTISNPEWASRDNFFSSDLIDTRIATFPLILGRERVNWLALVDGDIDLEWDAAGERNTWTFGEAKGEPLDIPAIRRASIRGTDIRYRNPEMDFLVDINVETVRASDTRFDEAIRFSGSGRARGNMFTLSGSLKSPNATVAGGRNELALHAESGATVMDVSGTLPGATVVEGADLDVAVRGDNMAELFDFIGVAVPDSRAYRMTSALTKADDEWRFTGLKGVVGESDLAGKLTIAMPEDRLHLDADLVSNTLDIVDIGPWIGYDPGALEARGADGAVRSVGGAPRVLPDAPLRVDALKAFDADLHYIIRRVRAESFPISNIDMTLKLDNSLLTLSPLTFDIAGGHLSSDIEINARGAPVRTTYDVRLSPTPLGQALAGFGVQESGTTGTMKARVQLSGEGDTVHESLASSDGRIAVILPRGTMWARNIQLSELDIGTFVQKMFEKELKEPVQINCGLVAFTVRDGIAAADPIIIDTRKNVILGHGGFSFKDERIDMAIRADAKTFSLFSGQSPIGIDGWFAEPSIDPISGELLARAGAGLGIGAVVAPLAAVIAFVDIGDAKAADCGPVLSGARATAQRTRGGERRDDVGTGTEAKADD